MTQRLSPLDFAFVDMEDEDPRASLAFSSVAVFQGPAPRQEEFVGALRARLPLVGPYRQKLRQVPLDLGPPVWVDDPSFDLGHHVRRTALPAPGDDAALSALMGRIMSQRLDRNHPLWEYWLVEGLSGGRWAVVSKVHHCMMDGISGTSIYRVLFDQAPKATRPVPTDKWQPAAEPSALRLTAHALAEMVRLPIEQAKMAGNALTSPRATLGFVLGTIRGLTKLSGALIPTTRSSLRGSIGQQRRYAVGRVPLAKVQAISRTAGVSLNDVVLAAVARAFRTVLLNRGEKPQPHSVRSLVPVSVRAKGDEDKYENQISVMLAFLPVHIGDPVGRLWAVHEHVTNLKHSGEAQAGAALFELAKHEPFAPIAWALRLAAHIPQRQIVTVTTNVPGPRETLYLLGRPMLEILPYVPIATQLRTGIAFFTYRDQLTIGVTGDYDFAPEVELIAREIEADLDELARVYQVARPVITAAPKKAVRKPAVKPANKAVTPAKKAAKKTVKKAAKKAVNKAATKASAARR
jgi:diacylglycerol O-acyltransferase